MNLFKPFNLLLPGLLLLASCNRTMQPSGIAYNNLRIHELRAADSVLLRMLRPYRDSVDNSMDEVVGTAAATLEKKQPTGSLGNFMADAILVMAAKQFGTQVDFAIVNYGGIRSNQLPAGSVTRGKVFELMPFDNLLVLQKLTGAQVQQLCDYLAARGGWPVAGASFTIKDKKATDIRIGGNPLSMERTYTLANSDYVANGGDDAAFLKPIPQINKGYLVRDAILAYIRNLHQAGQSIPEQTENRIRHAQ